MFKRNSLGISMLVLGVILSAGAPAFADNTRNLTLLHELVLQGKRLPPGEYTITWKSHSPRLTVTVSSGKKVLVTTSAMMVERNQMYDRDVIAVIAKADGTRTIREIRLGGTNQAIVFSEKARQENADWFALRYSLGNGGRRMSQTLR
jgi:hypothetical protein